jgi:hypothetical protein
MRKAIEDIMNQQEGLWVPRYTGEVGGSQQQPVTFKARDMLQTNRMSELPQPPGDQRYHIRKC